MNVTQILSKAHTMGVSLSLNGDAVKLRGPAHAIEALKPQLAPFKAEIVAHLRAAASTAEYVPADCVGVLHDPDGGLFLPWGPYLSPDELKQMRAELVRMIDCLARLEGWARELRDDVMGRAMRAPLSDLLPNMHHFRNRTAASHAAAIACARNRRCERLDERHYCPGCTGECIGTSKRCTRHKKQRAA
ncbi:hypothetical protein [Paraburkholderia terrae]|uniref:hypothetical protein n=1 Tax=Paraburkholderia terrae TaxID=311230 RepID=UPI001EE270D7|nr:hypothetical protein [Paraburkholderia terrae]GJH04489.1 hypothetical protein CBA19C8_28050 [Paraburkholderia terrae]